MPVDSAQPRPTLCTMTIRRADTCFPHVGMESAARIAILPGDAHCRPGTYYAIYGHAALKQAPSLKKLQAWQKQRASRLRWRMDLLRNDVAKAVLAPAGHMVYS